LAAGIPPSARTFPIQCENLSCSKAPRAIVGGVAGGGEHRDQAAKQSHKGRDPHGVIGHIQHGAMIGDMKKPARPGCRAIPARGSLPAESA